MASRRGARAPGVALGADDDFFEPERDRSLAAVRLTTRTGAAGRPPAV
ncbi:hypothetical protein ACRYCC_15680 [Actinomadura scrupuli]